MPKLGSWLLEEICRQAARWHASGLPRIPISVNVSVRQFQAGDVAKVVGDALTRSDLSPDFLQLEITESIAMHDVGQMIDHLERCRQLGVRPRLDDFGTGYSSLSFLLQFPVDVLKIDRSFVSGVPDNPHSVAIVEATLALAESLKLGVVAEGWRPPNSFGSCATPTVSRPRASCWDVQPQPPISGASSRAVASLCRPDNGCHRRGRPLNRSSSSSGAGIVLSVVRGCCGCEVVISRPQRSLSIDPLSSRPKRTVVQSRRENHSVS